MAANQSDHAKADYSARTDQVFAEIGYTQWTVLEPFANLLSNRGNNNGINAGFTFRF